MTVDNESPQNTNRDFITKSMHYQKVNSGMVPFNSKKHYKPLNYCFIIIRKKSLLMVISLYQLTIKDTIIIYH